MLPSIAKKRFGRLLRRRRTLNNVVNGIIKAETMILPPGSLPSNPEAAAERILTGKARTPMTWDNRRRQAVILCILLRSFFRDFLYDISVA